MPDDQYYRTLLHRLIWSEILIIVILTASAGGFAFLSSQKPKVQEKTTSERRLNVDAFHVHPVRFREKLTAYGIARPDREVIVAAQVSGEIVEVHHAFRVGTAVHGPRTIVSADAPSRRLDADILLRIDPRDYQERVQESDSRIREARREIEQLKQQKVNTRRRLEQARTSLEPLTQEYERIQTAFTRRSASASEVNRSLLELRRQDDAILQLENQLALAPHQIAAAEQRMQTSESNNDRARNDFEKTWVSPPFDGVLSEVLVERGQFVQSGSSLFRLVDPDIIEVPVSIGLDDWIQIAELVTDGQLPVVRLATVVDDGMLWEGTIVRVAPEADSGSRTISVFVEVDNQQQEQKLLPGTFLEARIDGREFVDVMVIPRGAILNDHVFVIDANDNVTRVPVVQGRRLRSLVGIKSGISGGERLATTNLDLLRDGLNVAVQVETDINDEIGVDESAVIELLPVLTEDGQTSTAAEHSLIQ